jgi:HSP20 family protein
MIDEARPPGPFAPDNTTKQRRFREMTNLVRWDPFADLKATMDRLFEEGFSRPWRLLPQEVDGTFPVEVAETDGEIEVKASLPGVRPDDVEVTVTNDILTIKAEHREETEERKKSYYRRELRYGSMQRQLALPAAVDVGGAQATYRDGILHLRLPKTEAERPKTIKVSAAPAAIEGKS